MISGLYMFIDKKGKCSTMCGRDDSNIQASPLGNFISDWIAFTGIWRRVILLNSSLSLNLPTSNFRRLLYVFKILIRPAAVCSRVLTLDTGNQNLRGYLKLYNVLTASEIKRLVLCSYRQHFLNVWTSSGFSVFNILMTKLQISRSS